MTLCNAYGSIKTANIQPNLVSHHFLIVINFMYTHTSHTYTCPQVCLLTTMEVRQRVTYASQLYFVCKAGTGRSSTGAPQGLLYTSILSMCVRHLVLSDN